MKKILLFSLFIYATSIFGQTGASTEASITVNGVKRTYRIYVPTMYDGSKPVPLIFNFHGLAGTSMQQEGYGDFRTIADTANFIIVHPQGLEVNFFLFKQTAFDVFASEAAAEKEINFITNLIDTIKGKYNINMGRIYSTGMSNGGFMSHELACQLSGRFAAIASVTGSMLPEHLSRCNPVHPTPVMQIHGTNDDVVKYDGTPGTTLLTFTHVDSLVRHWVNYNNCDTTAVTPLGDTLLDNSKSDNSQAVHFVFEGGDEGSTVELYRIINGIHAWPGTKTEGSGINQDFNASKEIWRFFEQHKNFVGIDKQEGFNFDFQVFPNPTSGIFTISLNNLNLTNYTVTVRDIIGNPVLTFSTNNSNTFSSEIDLTGIASGIYFVTIKRGDEEKTRKIILQ